ncbi:hypothetical protein SY212_07690 [Ligilactobacillus agilis]|uniref:Four-carbon acid sugar kinase family protein n=1 Tax=Ligilactobacillus agilis TaxID=1601 RepID=A0A6F9XKG5_9LACO|nr:four-carbon acid sugar kinase family protein [Ligilactobacillus agilis]NME41213.1 four-carbon acid sugar kinase family protein [Ligilactobacillus agilis]GET05739.1 hypothetical protein SY212_07690 [Ligilactobacillus agilis]
MRNKSLIIADDFTGSNDTGVQLRKKGFPIDVLLFPTNKKLSNSIVLDTESRLLSSKDAYQKVKKMTKSVVENNEFRFIYKKIDSTLRGNIATEIKAVADVTHPDKIVIAPAFPKIGRTTLNGRHYLNKVPLLETEIVNDPLTPIWTDNLIELLQNDFKDNIALHPASNFDDKKWSEYTIHVFDIQNDNDLIHLTNILKEFQEKILFVGSAGLAEYLFEKERLPTLSVVGSISEVSLEQMNFAESKGIYSVNVELNDLLNDSKIDKYSRIITNSLQQNGDTILTVTRKRSDYTKTIELFNSLGILDKKEISRIIRESLAKITTSAMSKTPIAGLFLTGGDTAIEIINECNSTGCQIISEIEPGIVQSTLLGGDFDGMKIITKAGAFGKKDSLYNSIQTLK